LLTKSEYDEFQGLLREFKSSKIKLDNLIRRIKQLFTGNEREVLLNEFVTFVPPKQLHRYKQILTSNESINKTIECEKSGKSSGHSST
jgi:histone deacetylase complex regulatory component SIN3